jgi:hypothetical protein
VEPTLAELHQLALPKDDVPHEIRKAAFETLFTVGLGLRLHPFPGLKFLPAAVGRRLEVRGLVCPEAPTTVWLVVRDSLADVIETTAHELKHVDQLLKWGGYTGAAFCSMPEREKAADAFGKSIRIRYERGEPLVDPPKRPAPALAPARRAAPSPRSAAPAARPAVTTVRRYTAPSQREAALLERRSRIYTTGGLKWICCEACSQAVLIGSSHTCPAAAQAKKRYGP